MIKLFKLKKDSSEIRRFQSQLGKLSADFIMNELGEMLIYKKGEFGFDYYKFNEPYEIVTTKKRNGNTNIII